MALMSKNLQSKSPSESSVKFVVGRLFRRYFAANVRTYAAAIFLMLISAVATALTAWMMKDVINKVFISGDWGATKLVALAMFAIISAKGIAVFGHLVLMGRVEISIVSDLRREFFNTLMSRDLAFYNQFPASSLQARFNTGAEAARKVIMLVINAVGRDLLTLLALIVVMLVNDALMTLLAFVTMPVLVISVAVLGRKARKVSRRAFDNQVDIFKFMAEIVDGAKVIKIFRAAPFMRMRMGASIDDLQANLLRQIRIAALTRPVTEILTGLSFALVVIYAGWSVKAGRNDAGELFSFLTAMMLAYEPAKKLGNVNVELQNASVQAAQMFEIIDQPANARDDAARPNLVLKKGKVALKNISFAYEGSVVIDGISFVAEGGKTTALVGPSGGGKSTLLNLIPQLFDLDTGQILIDGQDIAQVRHSSLLEHIAIVSQESVLFSGTIADNIGLGRLDASRADIKKAARAAHAHDFIMALSDGYDSALQEQGEGLSGGQRQRLSIARALLKDAPILLLDEATSALDSESEKLIQDALKLAMKGRTTIVIAHRLSTIASADKIIVIDQGKVVEQGTHAKLVAAKGLYARLDGLQQV